MNKTSSDISVEPAPGVGGVVGVFGASDLGGGRGGARVPVERCTGSEGVVADCSAVGPVIDASTVPHQSTDVR